ncbi:hypothetical protein SVAN01_01506 [Stagonosporopsis vannaccii]|nr:hypothetical protein SVAN01_01506 [Stagonosporopsis vannaccii]
MQPLRLLIFNMAPKKRVGVSSSHRSAKAKHAKNAKSGRKAAKTPLTKAKSSEPSEITKRTATASEKSLSVSRPPSSAAKKLCRLCPHFKAAVSMRTYSKETNKDIAEYRAAQFTASSLINATAIGTPEPEVSLVVRSCPSSAHDAEPPRMPNEPTPAYFRQLRAAAQTPGIRSFPSHSRVCPSTVDFGRDPTLLASNRDESTYAHWQPKIDEASIFVEQPIPVRTQFVVDAAKADIAVISTTSGLVSSLEDFDVYSITVKYRIPASSKLGAPQINVTWPAPPTAVASSDDNDSDDEPLIKRVAARDTHGLVENLALSKTTTKKNVARHQRAESSIRLDEPSPAKPSSSKSRTPAARARSIPQRRLTPIHHKDTVTWLSSRYGTPLDHFSPACRPYSPYRSTTVRRTDHWNHAMKNMLDYNTRRLHFPRRRVFSGPVHELGITLPRLEVFWKHMSDLIADKKLFARKLFEHWEKMDTCIRLVNERLGKRTAREEKLFGVDEGTAALGELGRRRTLWVAGGKVMLTRNALSSRKS